MIFSENLFTTRCYCLKEHVDQTGITSNHPLIQLLDEATRDKAFA
jgi:hypothetical protein